MCNRDCPDACGMVATVEDGRITRIEGDPDHPVTAGFLCYRTNKFLTRQYDPERITTPLLRTGDRFEPISWDRAIETIAAKLEQVLAESGPAAIFHYRSGGSMGLMKQITDYFFEKIGPVAIKSGDICSGAGDAAQETDFGTEEAHDWFDLRNSRTILMWGKNPFISSIHLVPLLRELKKRGTRFVQIDPVHHRACDFADVYLQSRPGGDIALAYGVARVLFETGRVDPTAGSYCDHLDGFEADAFARPLDEWARIADVDVAEIEHLAGAYADGPTALLVGWGVQRRAHGSASVRMLDALAAISGNLGVPGGGVSFSVARREAFNLSFLGGLKTAPRSIPEPLIGPGLLGASDPSYRFLWITAGNPVAMLPESKTVARALESMEMTVVVDSFLTDSARCAHLVLPAATMLEDDDLLGSYGHHYLGLMHPAVSPLGESKTDYQIVQLLARRMNAGDEFERTPDEWKRILLGRTADRGVGLEELERGFMRNPLCEKVPFADRAFPTTGGKVNLIREAPVELPAVDERRPMVLMALSTDKSQASQWPDGAQQGPALCTVHPEAAHGFADGAEVLLESEIASIRVKLRFDANQRRDVALMDKGGWHQRGRSANVLISAHVTDAGGGARYYDTPVRLLPVS
jgi:anaerobic selenocysteine-containing dehydrogenase